MITKIYNRSTRIIRVFYCLKNTHVFLRILFFSYAYPRTLISTLYIVSTRPLRSVGNNLLVVPRSKLVISARAFRSDQLQHWLFLTRYHLDLGIDPVIVLNHWAHILKHYFIATPSTTHSYASAPLIRLCMFYWHFTCMVDFCAHYKIKYLFTHLFKFTSM
jgi:hypothetical protein